MTLKKKCNSCGEVKEITEFHGARPPRPQSEATKKRKSADARARDRAGVRQKQEVEKGPRKVSARCVSCVIAARFQKLLDPNHPLNEPQNAHWKQYYTEQKQKYDAITQRKHDELFAIERAARREAARERRQRYVEANPEKVKEYMRNYMKEYREANKEAMREAQRKYYLANRERILEQRRKAYEFKNGLDLL